MNPALINTPPQRLALALDEVYKVFSVHQQPKHLHASPLKDVDRIFRDVTSQPLRELGEKQLWSFAFSAIWTVGDIDDYKHFLPRILELQATRGSFVDIEVTANKLEDIWRGWPLEEQQAIEAVMLAGLEYWLCRSPYDLDAWEWLAAIDRIGLDLEQTLSILFDASSANAAAQWAELINRNSTQLMIKRDFSEPLFSPKMHQAIRDRILSKALSEQLFQAVLEGSFPDEDLRLDVERAYNVLAGLQEQ